MTRKTRLSVRLARVSIEVALRKGAAGAGLQVALEGDRSPLVGKFDGDVKLPGR